MCVPALGLSAIVDDTDGTTLQSGPLRYIAPKPAEPPKSAEVDRRGPTAERPPTNIRGRPPRPPNFSTDFADFERDCRILPPPGSAEIRQLTCPETAHDQVSSRCILTKPYCSVTKRLELTYHWQRQRTCHEPLESTNHESRATGTSTLIVIRPNQ